MNKIRLLKSMRTRLLNKNCKNEKEFEDAQDKLNQIELEIKLEKAGMKKS